MYPEFPTLTANPTNDLAAVPASGTPSRRPAWQLSVVIDVALALIVYFGSYWLRFQNHQLATFLPAAWFTAPWIVGGQILLMSAAKAYANQPRASWLVRVTVGAVLGTLAGMLGVAVAFGFNGVSRAAFAADALLFSIGAVTWRALWVFSVRSPAAVGQDGDLIDRTAELTTVGGVVGSLYRYRELLKNLVLKDLKLKYRGSVFGFLWSLANPLLMIVVYTLAFTFILRVRSEGFVFYLMLGLLSWTFFANSAGMSTGAIVDNAGLLKSVLFPKAILPIATVLFNLAQYLLTVAVFLPVMMLMYRVAPAPPMVLFPVFLALHVVFTIGIALILATATAFFRDVRHLLEVTLAVMFWTTPIVYELRQVPERLQLLILLSPVSSFVVAFQQIFFYRQWPEPTVCVIACAHAIGAFVTGTLLFLAFEDRFTERL